jgi:hypothetical protein
MRSLKKSLPSLATAGSFSVQEVLRRYTTQRLQDLMQ